MNIKKENKAKQDYIDNQEKKKHPEYSKLSKMSEWEFEQFYDKNWRKYDQF